MDREAAGIKSVGGEVKMGAKAKGTKKEKKKEGIAAHSADDDILE